MRSPRVERLYPWAVVAGYVGEVTVSAVCSAPDYDLRRSSSRGGGAAGRETAAPTAQYACVCVAANDSGDGTAEMELQQLEAPVIHGNGSMEIVCRAPAIPEGLAWLHLRGPNGSTVCSEPVPLLVLRPSLYAIQAEVSLALRDRHPPPPPHLAAIFKMMLSVLGPEQSSLEELAECMRMAVTHGWEKLLAAIAGQLSSSQSLADLIGEADKGPLGLVSRAVLSGKSAVVDKMRRSLSHDLCVSRIPNTFTALHWSAAVGFMRSPQGKLRPAWNTLKAGPGAGLTPKQLANSLTASRRSPRPEDQPGLPAFWHVPGGPLLLEASCASGRRHWQLLRRELRTLNSHGADGEAVRSATAGPTEALAPLPRLHGLPADLMAPEDGCTSADAALHLGLFTIPCVLAVLSFPANSLEDLLWLVLMGAAVLPALVYSFREVLPEVCRGRQRLLEQLKVEASGRGASLGANFEFEDPDIQTAYERHCMARGSLLWDTLATSGKMVAAWVFPLLAGWPDGTVAGSMWTTIRQLGGHWVGLALVRGGLLALLGAKASRTVDTVMAPLYVGHIALSVSLCQVTGIPPLISAIPCGAAWPSTMPRGPMEAWEAVWVPLMPSLWTLVGYCLSAPLLPNVPARLYLARSSVHILMWPQALYKGAGFERLAPGRPGATWLHLLLLYGGCAFAVAVTGPVTGCFLWRLREGSLVRGFLGSRQFRSALAG